VAPSQQHQTIRIEARMSLPQGTGLWPAFWMLPEAGATAECSGCGVYGSWPDSGEIDIMEAANNMTVVNGTLHFGGNGQQKHVTRGAPIDPGFHKYALEWNATEMRWYVDDVQYNSVQSSLGGSNDGGWFSSKGTPPNAPFDVPFHIIINLAVGGSYGGILPAPEVIAESMAQGPKTLIVDWVRVLGR